MIHRVSSKASLVHELRTRAHGPGNCGAQQRAVTALRCFGGQLCRCSKVSWQAAGWSCRAVALLAAWGSAESPLPLASPTGMESEHLMGHVLLFSGVSPILALTSHWHLENQTVLIKPSQRGVYRLPALITYRELRGKVVGRATVTQDLMRSR